MKITKTVLHGFAYTLFGMNLAIAINRMFNSDLGIAIIRNMPITPLIVLLFFAIALFSLYSYFYMVSNLESKNNYALLSAYLFLSLFPLTIYGLISNPLKQFFDNSASDALFIQNLIYLLLYLSFLNILIIYKQLIKKTK